MAIAWIFAAGFCAGFVGEAGVFLHRQLAAVEAAIGADFKALAIPASGSADAATEARLKGLRGVAGVRRVSSSDALAKLRSEDPKLAAALAGGPRLPDAFELELSPEAISRLPAWSAETRTAEPGLELKLKPEEAEALLSVRFYGRYLAATGVLAAWGLACLAAVLGRQDFGSRFAGQWGAGSMGAGLGTLAGLVLAWRLRSPLPWAAPAWGIQAANVILGGFIGTSVRGSAR